MVPPLGSVSVEVNAKLNPLEQALAKGKAETQAFERSVQGSFDKVAQASGRMGDKVAVSADKAAQAERELAQAIAGTGSISASSIRALGGFAEVEKRLQAAATGATKALEKESTAARKMAADMKRAEKETVDFARSQNQVAGTTRLAGHQVTNFGYQLNDVVSGLIMGQRPFQILTQQGGQIVQVFGQHPAGVGGTFRALLGMFNPVVAGFVALAAVVGTGIALYTSYASRVRDAEVALLGLGRTAGMTAGDFMASAEAAAESADISVGAARRQQAEYLRMGITNSGVLAELIEVTRDYARVTGQEATEAVADLGRQFADPIKGAESLNERLNLLDADTTDYIRTLVEQNRVSEAQTVLLRELQDEVSGMSDETNILASAWNNVARAASNAFSAMSRGVNVRLGGGTTADQLEASRASERSLIGRANTAFAGLFGAPSPFGERTRELEAQLEAEQAQARANAQAAERNRLSREGAEAAAALMPWERQRGTVSAQIADIERARAAGTMDEVTATRALTVARRRLADIDETAGRLGAPAPRRTGNRREESLRRNAEAMELNTRASYDMAAAYLESADAGMVAEVRRQALTQATRRGIDVEAELQRQIAQNIAQAAANAAKQVAGAREHAAAQREVNDAVASGAMTTREAAEALQIATANRDLENLALIAEGDEREAIRRIIDAQTAALREHNRQQERAQVLRQLEGMREENELLALELTLIGRSNIERARAINQLQTLQALRSAGIDPASPEGMAFAGAGSEGVETRGQLELASFMDATTERVREQIQAFEDDARAIGMTIFEATRFRAEQDMLSQAQARGIELTDTQRAQIAGLAEAYAHASEEARLLQEHVKALDDAARFGAETFAGFFDELVWGSGDAEDALRNLLKSLGQAMFQAFALGQGPLAGILGTASNGKAGGGSGGILNSIFGALFKVPVGHSGIAPYGQAATSRMVSPAMFISAPRLHDGLKADEFPAILQRGERVVPKSRKGDMGGTVVYMTVQTNDADSFRRSDRQIGRQLKRRLAL